MLDDLVPPFYRVAICVFWLYIRYSVSLRIWGIQELIDHFSRPYLAVLSIKPYILHSNCVT